MQTNLGRLAVRGALGALMLAGGLMSAPAFAANAHSHGHTAGHSSVTTHGHGSDHGTQKPHGGDTSTLNGHATLAHTPTGTATLAWDSASHQLTVGLSLSGLTPGGGYTANVEQGTCDAGGTVLYPLTGLTADAHGTGTSQTSVSNVTGQLPHHGWFVAVNQGGAMVACGNVRDEHGGHGKHHHGSQTAKVALGPTKAANQHVGGEAHLQLKNGTLTAGVNAHGLSGGTTYPVEIGQGTCSLLGGTPVYTLNPLAQDAHGDWRSTTTETGVTTLPRGQWYVAIWSHDHSDLLACGNVRTGGHD